MCSWKELPTGKPQVLFDQKCEKARLTPNHADRYFGFARVKVKPNQNDFIAILPQRKEENGEEKLIYDLYIKTGCWHTELIYLAMEHGYEVRFSSIYCSILECWEFFIGSSPYSVYTVYSTYGID